MKNIINQNLMPAIFFGHGSPMNAILPSRYSKIWSDVAKTFPKPKSILAISAHWETSGTRITSNKKQKIIYDFYGFPEELYQVKYEAVGSESLVERVLQLAPEVSPDNSWGLDHGTWSVLKYLYPQADIAIVQLSLDLNKTPEQHYELAKKLKTLRG